MSPRELPIPAHFDPEKVKTFWRVPYQERADEAERWAEDHNIQPASEDAFRISLMLVDVQNTFCIPGFEMFVGGRSGTAAVEDNIRLCRFIYRNLQVITQISPTMDTHTALQVFHSVFLTDSHGNHPPPFTTVSPEDIEEGRWRFNPALAGSLGITRSYADEYLRHYTNELEKREKYDYTIWPYHAMLGGIGHALVSSVEEAAFFHGIARKTQPDFQVKGENPLTENYSVLRPEVMEDAEGRRIARKNTGFIQRLLDFDAVVIAGQAKSHCVFWTVDDLLNEIKSSDPTLVDKVYLLEDCTSSIVVPGVVDYTDQADAAFDRFARSGMHLVRSTEPIQTWPAATR